MPIELTPLPMAEAQAFWADKVQLGAGEFAKLSAEAKVKAFAVSGIARGDELTTVFEAIRRAIDQGTTLADFKKECGAIFERRGWTGKRTWRVDNIFRTNIQTAYNVGKYKRLKDSGLFPYWQYSAINDRRTRPTHLAMDGRVWPADHPTWDTWFPPNGYRCRCSVIGLTARQAERMGVKIEEDDPTNGLIEPIDPITGNRMPARQLLPDPGFAINSGAVYWQGMTEVIAERAESWRPEISRDVLRELAQGPVLAWWLDHPEGNFPVALLEGRAVRVAAEAAGSLAGLVSAERLVELVEQLLAQPDRRLSVVLGGRTVRLVLIERDGKLVVVESRA